MKISIYSGLSWIIVDQSDYSGLLWNIFGYTMMKHWKSTRKFFDDVSERHTSQPRWIAEGFWFQHPEMGYLQDDAPVR